MGKLLFRLRLLMQNRYGIDQLHHALMLLSFVFLLFGMAWLVLYVTFKRFRSGTWYELIMAARDLL